MQELSATGLEALDLGTRLLQRARRAHPVDGLWEAADVQWAWRASRLSDEAQKLFWLDADGPVAGVLLTSWPGGAWQCDPVTVPGCAPQGRETVWVRALDHVARYAKRSFEVPVDDADTLFVELAERSGLAPLRQDRTAWLDAADRPEVPALADGFVITDRTERQGTPHPMRQRNGEEVAQRLEQCSLYDPALDIAVERSDGRPAGYSLYWFDPQTLVGLVEPVRIEAEFQRLGLARAMVSEGIARLVRKGARRVKVSYETAAAGALYEGLGFRPTSTTTWYGLPAGVGRPAD